MSAVHRLHCLSFLGLALTPVPSHGEVPEWPIGTDSKSVVPFAGHRGFESLPLRHLLLTSLRRVQCQRQASIDFFHNFGKGLLELCRVGSRVVMLVALR